MMIQIEPFPDTDHPACEAGISIALSAAMPALRDNAESDRQLAELGYVLDQRDWGKPTLERWGEL